MSCTTKHILIKRLGINNNFTAIFQSIKDSSFEVYRARKSKMPVQSQCLARVVSRRNFEGCGVRLTKEHWIILHKWIIKYQILERDWRNRKSILQSKIYWPYSIKNNICRRWSSWVSLYHIQDKERVDPTITMFFSVQRWKRIS